MVVGEAFRLVCEGRHAAVSDFARHPFLLVRRFRVSAELPPTAAVFLGVFP